jgi:recombination protein RecA
MAVERTVQSSVSFTGGRVGTATHWDLLADGTHIYFYMKGMTNSMDERKKAVEDAIKQIEKRFGEGTIAFLGGASHMVVDTISTGSIALDVALGGGVPRGRVVEVYGPESSGKTTLCLHVIANAQQAGGVAAFIDMEHALDPAYAARLGVNIDELYVSQPDTGEQALEICEALVRSGGMSVVVVDSVAALVPLKEIEGEMGDAVMGLQARLMSQALRKLSGVISKTGTVVIFTNQLRQKIGVMFGNPETTTGGNALKFYASQRLDVRRVQALKSGDEVLGNRTRVKVVKNKIAPPFRTAEFDIVYNEGISKDGELIDLGVSTGVLERRGSHFSFGDRKLGQGRENVRDTIKANPDLAAAIEAGIREALKGQTQFEIGEADVAEEE